MTDDRAYGDGSDSDDEDFAAFLDFLKSGDTAVKTKAKDAAPIRPTNKEDSSEEGETAPAGDKDKVEPASGKEELQRQESVKAIKRIEQTEAKVESLEKQVKSLKEELTGTQKEGEIQSEKQEGDVEQVKEHESTTQATTSSLATATANSDAQKYVPSYAYVQKSSNSANSHADCSVLSMNSADDTSLLSETDRSGVDISSVKSGSEKKVARDKTVYTFTKKGILKKDKEVKEEEGMQDDVKGKSIDELRRDELMKVMKDRSLSKEEKARKMEEVKQKYGGGGGANTHTKTAKSAAPVPLAANECKVNESPMQSGGFTLSATSAPDRAREFAEVTEVMNDNSLSTKEKGQKLEEIRHKYSDDSSSAIGTIKSFDTAPTISESISSDDDSLRKSSPVKYKDLGKKSSDASKKNDARYVTRVTRDDGGVTTATGSIPVEEQRRAELQAVMKDKSLSRVERRDRINEVNEKYAAMTKGGKAKVIVSRSSNSSSSSSAKCFEKGKRLCILLHMFYVAF